MIIFVPAYDISTQSNFNFIKTLNFTGCITLFTEEATREKLLEILARSEDHVFAMSHGKPDILFAQKGQIALSTEDKNILGNRSFYAFACYTAIRLGESVAKQGGIWWGYSNSVTCYIDHPDLIQFFQQIFQLIYDNFAHSQSEKEVQELLEKLRQLCEQIQDDLNLLFSNSSNEYPEILGILLTVRQIWERLRVWLPEQTIPLQHPQAPSTNLPWL